jgi:hypothetical protein
MMRLCYDTDSLHYPVKSGAILKRVSPH